MAERSFFTSGVRSELRTVIEQVEAKTSAELVVSIRKQSDSYRVVDLALGALAGYAVLLLLLFHPVEFAVQWMPLEIVVAGVVAALLSASAWSHKRWLIPTKQQRGHVRRAACEVFYSRGMTRTSGRNGVLVFVSMLERRVDVLVDIGIDEALLGADWVRCKETLGLSISRVSLPEFTAALASMGEVLGESMPRADDDVNELPDEPEIA